MRGGMEQQKGLDFGPGAEKPKPQRRTWTVSQLTDRLQGVLETEFFDVWVEGEVSNVTMPASGHWYFSLKDANAQVRAVVWKTAARLIKFKPRDGMKVLVRGAVRVYPPKGEYQIAVAVIQDILRVVERRYANLEIAIYPARVQGPEAVPDIVRGIRAINRVSGF